MAAYASAPAIAPPGGGLPAARWRVGPAPTQAGRATGMRLAWEKCRVRCILGNRHAVKVNERGARYPDTATGAGVWRSVAECGISATAKQSVAFPQPQYRRLLEGEKLVHPYLFPHPILLTPDYLTPHQRAREAVWQASRAAGSGTASRLHCLEAARRAGNCATFGAQPGLVSTTLAWEPQTITQRRTTVSPE